MISITDGLDDAAYGAASWEVTDVSEARSKARQMEGQSLDTEAVRRLACA